MDQSLKCKSENYKAFKRKQKRSDVSKMMVPSATFVSPFQSTTSKTSITQLCPTDQDAGELQTSVYLKVGGLEHK